ncbi:hypothetical protein HIM_03714 [Hirsutella minnesotensis 3608]|uniref:Uncharacterized protein n=1 Tax=Hirsutella minnesotensis 3608 TaxID=1043627 RepID=A0A0F8A292_9HYPO|nr:hypothetical protein HIM_03714 [Hirsutella minnesotensis 3608]
MAGQEPAKEMRIPSLVEPDAASTHTARYAYEPFDRKSQFRRLLFRSLTRWLITVALAASIYGVLWSYSSKPVLASKRAFNVVILGLSIGLGLNIASSLKGMVSETRWWLLSLRPTSPREADLILQSENLSRMILLGLNTSRFSIKLFVSFWLLVNLAAQIALATLGLTYNVNPSDKFALTRPGLVSVPDMSEIQTNKVLSPRPSQAISALRYTANSYGLVALAIGFGSLHEIPQPGAVFNPDNNLTFCGQTSCRYVFYEATPSHASYFANVATNRYVETSASCQGWRVLQGGDGLRREIVIDDSEKSKYGPLPALNGPEQTLFMHNPAEPSGDTWSIVMALEASSTDPWFYRCNVTIGSVINAVAKEHLVGTSVSRMAAPAIALQGYGASTTGVANSTTQLQFQSYPAESSFGRPVRGDTNAFSLLLAQFSCGVLTVVAQSNSNILVPGLMPIKGVTLEITSWKYVHLILATGVGLQLLLTVLALVTANSVQVRSHSHLAMAGLLRPVLRDVSSVANGRQVASMMGADARLSYAPGRGGGYHLLLER